MNAAPGEYFDLPLAFLSSDFDEDSMPLQPRPAVTEPADGAELAPPSSVATEAIMSAIATEPVLPAVATEPLLSPITSESAALPPSEAKETVATSEAATLNTATLSSTASTTSNAVKEKASADKGDSKPSTPVSSVGLGPNESSTTTFTMSWAPLINYSSRDVPTDAPLIKPSGVRLEKSLFAACSNRLLLRSEQ